MAIMPQHVLALAAGELAPLNMTCVDGAATAHASWDEEGCYDIEPCKVLIKHADSSSNSNFEVSKKGKRLLVLEDKHGKRTKVVMTDVLISDRFPFHILSEIALFNKKCVAIKRQNSWQFYAPSGKPLLHASQRLKGSAAPGTANRELYFVDGEGPVPASTNAVAAVTRASSDALAIQEVPTAQLKAARSQIGQGVEPKKRARHADTGAQAKTGEAAVSLKNSRSAQLRIWRCCCCFM
jgi:hypothetical protein